MQYVNYNTMEENNKEQANFQYTSKYMFVYMYI